MFYNRDEFVNLNFDRSSADRFRTQKKRKFMFMYYDHIQHICNHEQSLTNEHMNHIFEVTFNHERDYLNDIPEVMPYLFHFSCTTTSGDRQEQTAVDLSFLLKMPQLETLCLENFLLKDESVLLSVIQKLQNLNHLKLNLSISTETLRMIYEQMELKAKRNPYRCIILQTPFQIKRAKILQPRCCLPNLICEPFETE